MLNFPPYNFRPLENDSIVCIVASLIKENAFYIVSHFLVKVKIFHEQKYFRLCALLALHRPDQ